MEIKWRTDEPPKDGQRIFAAYKKEDIVFGKGEVIEYIIIYWQDGVGNSKGWYLNNSPAEGDYHSMPIREYDKDPVKWILLDDLKAFLG